MNPDDSYVTARSVLLDALDALGPQRASCVLVGAQAVYVHTGDVPGTGVSRTTDGDLMLYTELLQTAPELTRALTAAGFTSSDQPGSWVGAQSVRVDIMTAPHQSFPARASSRSARLPHHGRQLARITPGLEAALVDHHALKVSSLSPGDRRSHTLEVAGPAALLVAKATKLRERHREAAEGYRSRVNTKDAVDCLRLLTVVDTADLVRGFERHCQDPHAQAASSEALRYFAAQLDRGAYDEVRRDVERELGDLVLTDSYSALMEDLLVALPEHYWNRDEGITY